MNRLILFLVALLLSMPFSQAGDADRSFPAIPLLLLSEEPLPYEPSMIAPYRDEAKIASINEAYSEAGAYPPPPWSAHPHDGIDFMPVENLVEFQAVGHGTVERVEKYGSKGQVTVIVRYNETYSFNYAFEPQQAAAGDEQLARIAVGVGQQVVPGQLIGRQVKPDPDSGGAHLHFGLLIDFEQKCPEPFFTQPARESILRILHKLYPGAKMCYLAP